MFKKIIPAVFAIGVFCFSSVRAQDHNYCYTTQIYKERIKNHPEILESRRALEESTRQFNERRISQNQITGQILIIPIVFHILHNYGTENISDAQIIDEVRILNDDYRKTSYDTASIAGAFKPIAADCEIEFRLAQIDPNGHCTNGIDRIPSMLTFQADDNSKLNPWPDNQYLNVWVVASLSWIGVAAYAYYPGTAPAGADGVITTNSYIGSIGTGSVARSRVLTHEIGHCFNLEHVWGDTNEPGVSCGDDGVSDTPVTSGWTVCNLSGATCGNVIDNVQNYMEYSYCCNMFTVGQKTRMRAALASPVGGRNNLSTLSNLISTGTDNTTTQVCEPVADFKVNFDAMCEGVSVHFTDQSWNGTPVSWSWNFPGGTPSSSTDPSPTIQYNTAGAYDVSLTVTNATGSDSITKTTLIHVNGTTTQTVPYYENFETAGSFPLADGYITNYDGGNAWHRVTNAGSSGTSSVMMNNFSGNEHGQIDEFITPAFDFSNVTSLTMDFKVAYAFEDTMHSEALQVFSSTNCGHSWNSRYYKQGQVLATVTGQFSNFIPNSSQWRQESVNIGALHNQTNVRFKFRHISGAGNNLYIDDINLNGIVAGIHENTDGGTLLRVFPNPSHGNFNVVFDLTKNENVKLKITDALGRQVKELVNSMLQPGEHKFSVDKNQLSEGIYFIIFDQDGRTFSRKLIVTMD